MREVGVWVGEARTNTHTFTLNCVTSILNKVYLHTVCGNSVRCHRKNAINFINNRRIRSAAMLGKCDGNSPLTKIYLCLHEAIYKR
jgi:hypothetical protein